VSFIDETRSECRWSNDRRVLIEAFPLFWELIPAFEPLKVPYNLLKVREYLIQFLFD
jgi:hypothetical protein